MNRKLAVAFFAAIILILFLIFVLNFNFKKSSDSTQYLLGNQKVGPGYIMELENPKTALLVGKLTRLESKDNKIYGLFEFKENRREKIMLYTPDLETIYLTQKTQNLLANQRQVNRLRSYSNAQDALNRLIGSNIILFVYQEEPSINKTILSCNTQLISSLKGNSAVSCTPLVYVFAVYAP